MKNNFLGMILISFFLFSCSQSNNPGTPSSEKKNDLDMSKTKILNLEETDLDSLIQLTQEKKKNIYTTCDESKLTINRESTFNVMMSSMEFDQSSVGGLGAVVNDLARKLNYYAPSQGKDKNADKEEATSMPLAMDMFLPGLSLFDTVNPGTKEEICQVKHYFRNELVESKIYMEKKTIKNTNKNFYVFYLYPDAKYKNIFKIVDGKNAYSSYITNESTMIDRVLYFTNGAISFLKYLNKLEGYKLKVHHSHGLLSPLIPLYYKKLYKEKEEKIGLEFVFSIHNLNHDQGIFKEIRYHNELINFFKIGVAYSDKVHLVSNNIKKDGLNPNPAISYGLYDFFKRKEKLKKLYAIGNAIDSSPEGWSFYTKDKLQFKDVDRIYDFSLAAKENQGQDDYAKLKRKIKKLLASKGYIKDIDRPLYVYVGRYSLEKGIELLEEVADHLDKNGGSLIIMGSKAPDEKSKKIISDLYEKSKTKWQHVYVMEKGDYQKEQLVNNVGYLIRAASQFSIVPSYEEAFGLVPLEFFAFGSPTVASGVQGMSDWLKIIDGNDISSTGIKKGNGFKFNVNSMESVRKTLDQSLHFYDGIQKNSLESAFVKEIINQGKKYDWFYSDKMNKENSGVLEKFYYLYTVIIEEKNETSDEFVSETTQKMTILEKKNQLNQKYFFVPNDRPSDVQGELILGNNENEKDKNNREMENRNLLIYLKKHNARGAHSTFCIRPNDTHDELVYENCNLNSNEKKIFKMTKKGMEKELYYSISIGNNHCVVDDPVGKIKIENCDDGKKEQLFKYQRDTLGIGTSWYHLENVSTGLCLTGHGGKITSTPCRYGNFQEESGGGQKIVIEDSFPSIRLKFPLKNFIELENKNSILYDSNANITSSSKPNIFVIFMDTFRKDHLTKKITPNILKFAENNINVDTVYAPATNTHHSLYSLFYSRLAVDRDLMATDIQFTKGPPFLNLLKNGLKYKTHAFTFPDHYFKYKIQGKMPPNDEYEQNQILWGKEAFLMDTIPDVAPYYPHWRNGADWDWKIFDQFKNLFERLGKEKIKEGGNFFQFMFYGLHPNFSHKEDLPLNYRKPTFTFQTWPGVNPGNRSIYNADTLGVELLRNSYINAAMSFDYLFGKLITYLKDNDVYEDSIIVFHSDHGTELYEHNAWGHGGFPYKTRGQIPLVLKIPGLKEGKKVEDSVSLVDLYPTLFSSLDVKVNETPISKFSETIFYGSDILDGKKNRCPVITMSNGYGNYPESIIVISGNWKATFLFGDINFDLNNKKNTKIPMSSTSWRLVSLTDQNDNPIYFEVGENRKSNIEQFFNQNVAQCIRDIVNYGTNNNENLTGIIW